MDWDGWFMKNESWISDESMELYFAALDALATLRHDWCRWEYDLDPSIRWDCEGDWR